jgi:hypothetical protein
MIFNRLFCFSSILILMKVQSSLSLSSIGSLCKIELFVDKNQFSEKEKIEFTNVDSNQTEIYSDTYYEAVCLTNEQVRSRNFIYLETSYTSEEKTIKKHDQLANRTFKRDNLNYLRGGFTIDSASQRLNHSLFCRFLPVNPVGVYCEKTIYLIVIPKTNQNIKIFLIILSIVVFIGVVNLVVKCCIMRRKKSSSNLNTKRMSSTRSFSRTNRKSNKPGDSFSNTLRNGNLDINYSIYSLDDIQVKIAQRNDCTSQVLINGQPLNKAESS